MKYTHYLGWINRVFPGLGRFKTHDGAVYFLTRSTVSKVRAHPLGRSGMLIGSPNGEGLIAVRRKPSKGEDFRFVSGGVLNPDRSLHACPCAVLCGSPCWVSSESRDPRRSGLRPGRSARPSWRPCPYPKRLKLPDLGCRKAR
jgi:hypothetical protein